MQLSSLVLIVLLLLLLFWPALNSDSLFLTCLCLNPFLSDICLFSGSGFLALFFHRSLHLALHTEFLWHSTSAQFWTSSQCFVVHPLSDHVADTDSGSHNLVSQVHPPSSDLPVSCLQSRPQACVPDICLSGLIPTNSLSVVFLNYSQTVLLPSVSSSDSNCTPPTGWDVLVSLSPHCQFPCCCVQ